ncbi:MAG: hypothetical protein WB990_17020, partial [Candidatus Acidiferrales bacterium]
STCRSSVTICSGLYFLIGIPASLQSEFSLTPAGTKTPGQVSLISCILYCGGLGLLLGCWLLPGVRCDGTASVLFIVFPFSADITCGVMQLLAFLVLLPLSHCCEQTGFTSPLLRLVVYAVRYHRQ